ncbi:MAG: hypothetical protein WCU88_04445 [Elusimicrobiota bacterium]|jgi:hypothetical protein
MMPEPPQPPQPPERNSDEMLEGMANLDTARMTLRWALERMRLLEAGQAEMRELLKTAVMGREEAVRGLDNFRISVDERVSRLAERERFVAEMQSILNNLFKGDLSVEDFVRRRTALEKTQEDLEARVRKRLSDAEEAHKREVAEHAKLLGEMESTYSRSLADAQKRFHEELAEMESRYRAELDAERAKTSASREESLAEVRLQADQFHQRALLLETEHSSRRKSFEEDLGRMQVKLQEEHRQALVREQSLHQTLREQIESEKKQLESELALKEQRISELRNILLQAEAAAGEREEAARRQAFSDFSRERAAFGEQLQAMRREAASQAERLAAEISALQAELAERDLRLGREREQLLTAQQETLRRSEERHEAELEALRASLEQWRQQGLQAQTSALEESDRRHGEREQDLRSAHRKELEVLRSEHSSRIESLYGDIAHLRERHESELKLRAEEAARIQTSWRAAAQDREQRASQEIAALQEQHRLEADRLEEDLRRRRQEFDAERQALAKEIEKARADSSSAHSEALRGIEKLFAERATQTFQTHAQTLQSLEAEHRTREEELRRQFSAESNGLRSELRGVREAFEAERATLIEEQTRIRRQDLVKFEEALHGLERFFLERNNQRLKETVSQIEELRRGYSRLLSAQKREAQQEAERLRREAADLQAALERRPEPPLPVHHPSFLSFLEGLPWAFFAWCAAALLALSGAAAIWTFGLLAKDYPVPFSHPTSLLWEGDVLWASDPMEQAAYRFQLTESGLSLDRRIPVQGVRLTGLARVRGDLYAIDADSRVIARLRPEGGALIVDRSWPAPGSRPSAILFDGKDLWTADAGERRLYRHAVDETLQVLETRPAQQAVASMASDGTRLWTADDAGNWLAQPLRYAAQSQPYRWLPFLSEAPAPPTCMAFRGRNLWTARDGEYRFQEIPVWRLRPEPIDRLGVID